MTALLPVFKRAIRQFLHHRVLRLSAALAFYSVFSIGPLLMIAISVSGLVYGEEAVRGQMESQLNELMGPRSARTVEDLIASSAKQSDSVLMTITGLVVLVFGATGVFGQLKDSLNTIWEVQLKPGKAILSFLRDRFLSFSMILVIGFLLLISMVLSAGLHAFGGVVAGVLPFSAIVWLAAGESLSFLVVTFLFAMIFKILPDVKTRWSDVWVGSAVTALLFSIGKAGIGFYLGREETASPYGAAGALVLVLLWVYYASVILLFGAEFTRSWAIANKRHIGPSGQAESISSMEMREQGIPGKIDS